MALSNPKLTRRVSGKTTTEKARPERTEGNPMQEGLFSSDPGRLSQNLPAAEIVDKITTAGCSRSRSGMTVFIP
jgi:hypothetical protein